MKMEYIRTTDFWGRSDCYLIVDKIRRPYFVWNIGENMNTEDFIPLCRQKYPGAPPDSPYHYHIDRDSLQAIQLPNKEVLLLRDAAGFGVNCLEAAEEALKRISPNSKDKYKRIKRSLAEKTVSIFRKISA